MGVISEFMVAFVAKCFVSRPGVKTLKDYHGFGRTAMGIVSVAFHVRFSDDWSLFSALSKAYNTNGHVTQAEISLKSSELYLFVGEIEDSHLLSTPMVSKSSHLPIAIVSLLRCPNITY